MIECQRHFLVRDLCEALVCRVLEPDVVGPMGERYHDFTAEDWDVASKIATACGLVFEGCLLNEGKWYFRETGDPRGKHAVVKVDPVMSYDPNARNITIERTVW